MEAFGLFLFGLFTVKMNKDRKRGIKYREYIGFTNVFWTKYYGHAMMTQRQRGQVFRTSQQPQHKYSPVNPLISI